MRLFLYVNDGATLFFPSNRKKKKAKTREGRIVMIKDYVVNDFITRELDQTFDFEVYKMDFD